MILLESAKEYWTIVSRYNRNRHNPMMPGVATRDMRKLGETVTSPAVKRRIARWVAQPLSGDPFDGGPELA